jgi:hypothetical protein
MIAILNARLIAWLICGAVALITFLTYVGMSRSIGGGDVVMPLDDAYIHFQYARSIADGHPYVYNPGQAPTSGATSLLYPYLLAAGYAIGCRGLDLGLWAMGIGAVALLVSAWLVYLLARAYRSPGWLAIGLTLAFALNGSIAWHFMSGMETGLMIAFALWSLYAVVTGAFWPLTAASSLLTLTRPEGGILGLMAVAAYLGRVYRSEQPLAAALPPARCWALLLPVLAIGAQPLVNLVVTGSALASGNQAKSILGVIPFDWPTVIRRVLENLTRMWRELSTGRDGDFSPGVISLLAFVGWISLLRDRERRAVGAMLVAWFVALTAAISTLDTAFWHFKRYQMPLIALLYPLASWGLNALWSLDTRAIMRWAIQRTPSEARRVRLRVLLPQIILAARLYLLIFIGLHVLLSVLTTRIEFARLYRVNLRNVAVQPLAMARWLRANTHEDAVIAVHDVGMMRYVGQRHAIDMVGLTTPGAADAWRNGPGAVAEFLMSHNPRPDYMAAYTTARGLNYLVETSLYGDLLAEFPAQYDPADNVALAAEYQGIYRVDWATIDAVPAGPMQSTWRALIEAQSAPPRRVDQVDVADLASEAAHDYVWRNLARSPGFVTEVYELNYVACDVDTIGTCRVLDAGRRINGEETFTLRVPNAGRPLLLVTRLHPVNRGVLEIYVNGLPMPRRWIPDQPGRWIEVATYIPPDLAAPTLEVRIVPRVEGGYYMPYHHFVLELADPLLPAITAAPLITFPDLRLDLVALDVDLQPQSRRLTIDLTWQPDLEPQGDYRLFVHVMDDLSQPPLLQADQRLGGGALPPGNLLPGELRESLTFDLAALPGGTYRVAIGFYDPISGERMTALDRAESDEIIVDRVNRVMIASFELAQQD